MRDEATVARKALEQLRAWKYARAETMLDVTAYLNWEMPDDDAPSTRCKGGRSDDRVASEGQATPEVIAALERERDEAWAQATAVQQMLEETRAQLAAATGPISYLEFSQARQAVNDLREPTGWLWADDAVHAVLRTLGRTVEGV